MTVVGIPSRKLIRFWSTWRQTCLAIVGGGGILRVISSHFPPISFLVPVTTSMDLRGPRTIEEGDIFCKVISREEIAFITIVLMIVDMTNTLHYSEGDRHTDHTVYVLKGSTACRAPIEDTT